MAVLLGLDAGGAYTDAALWDEAAGRLIGKAKAPTTHRDLPIGLGAAAEAALRAGGVAPGEVALVSLATTLATNALVEGQGEPAGLVLIGFGPAALAQGGLGAALGGDPCVAISGGRTTEGAAAAPFDEAALRAGLREAAPRVSAFAVAGLFAVRNPEDERRAAAIVAEETGLPVTMSHELSARLGGPKRALTTLLNARLVGMLGRLIEAAGARLSALGIEAPLMVVKGDGALMRAETARRRPVETILSGPAASLVGAGRLAGRARAIVADIGSTTTDLAALEGGAPRLDPEGATIGGFATMVEAAAVRTHGLGGDSEIGVEAAGLSARLTVGPRRAIPLSDFAEGRGFVLETLRRQAARGRWAPGDGAFLTPGGVRFAAAEPGEAALLVSVGEGAAEEDLALGPRARAALGRLLARGALRRAAFTPTDAARALGRHDGGVREAAELGARILARRKGGDGRALAPDGAALSEMALAALVRRSAERVLGAALAADGLAPELADGPLAAAALDRRGAGGAGFAALGLGLSAPLVALGAPAASYYPAVGRLLGAEVVVPEHAEVAGAVGAVAGRVSARAEALVLPAEAGGFALLFEGPPSLHADLAAARAAAEAAVTAAAMARAAEAGAEAPEARLRWEEKHAEVEGRPVLVEARLTAMASGRPAFRAG